MERNNEKNEAIKELVIGLSAQANAVYKIKKRLEELYAMQETKMSEFHFGFHFGELFSQFKIFEEDSKTLSNELQEMLLSNLVVHDEANNEVTEVESEEPKGLFPNFGSEFE